MQKLAATMLATTLGVEFNQILHGKKENKL